MTLRWMALGLIVVMPLQAQGPTLTLTYLGNMGVLLEQGDRRIVIDGFHRGGLPEYAAVPEPLLLRLETAVPPYERLTAALTTHRHADHFDRASVVARLTADLPMVYGAPAEIMDSLAVLPGAVAGTRLRPIWGNGSGQTGLGGGIVALDLRHNPVRSLRPQNVGYLIELGGVRILHVGDADPQVDNYAPYRLAEKRIDIAIVPYWYLSASNSAVRNAIAPRVWVASHIPLADTAQARARVLTQFPTARVLAAPGERLTLP